MPTASIWTGSAWEEIQAAASTHTHSGAYEPTAQIAQVTDRRFLPQAASAVPTTTSASFGNGTLRLSPGYIPNQLTISQVGAEVTTVGEAGSKFRIGIYRDTGLFYPGTLLLDGGQIAGDSATSQEIDVADFVMVPGWYWFGGVIQSAPTTQPAMRAFAAPGVTGLVATALVSGSSPLVGYSESGVTGALPATFTASLASSFVVARISLRLA